MQRYFVLAAAVALGLEPVLCCFGGLSGGGNNPDGSINDYALTTSPYFELNYNPPVWWTTPTGAALVTSDPTQPTPTFEQAPTLDDATKRANNTIRLTLIDALVSRNVPITSATTYDLSEIQGQEIDLVDITSMLYAVAGNGLVEGDVVVSECTGPDACTNPYVLNPTIQIKNGPLLSGRQWKDVASALQVALQLEGIRFTEPIIVTET